MIKVLIVTIYFTCSLTNFLVSQSHCELKYDYIWILGGEDNEDMEDKYGGTEINFNDSPVSFIAHPKPIDAPRQNISMCSEDGNLIFYSNGCLVLNALDTVMKNGDMLNPGEIYPLFCPIEGYRGFQNMISLPFMYDDSLYYLLHINHIFNYTPGAPFIIQSENVYCTTIRFTATDSLGIVIEKNRIVFTDTGMIGTPLTAVKHGNGYDWWVITPDRWTNSFNTILIDQDGPHYIGKQDVGFEPNPLAEAGQGKFSPDGSKFAWFHPKNGLFLYDFNRLEGFLFNFQHIDITLEDFLTGGCEFSPSGQFLYVNNDKDLFQVDVLADDIQKSVTHIASYDGFGEPLPTRFFFMERTPDNRIFMNVVNGSQYLHVIQEPNLKGTDCRFEQHALKLPTVNNFTLPHFPNYRLGAIQDPLCDTVVVSTEDGKPNMLPFRLFPNPVGEHLSITWEIDQNPEIRIYSSDGMLIQSTLLYDSRQRHLDINCETWTPGIYFVQFITPLGMVTEKVIKL